MSGPRWDPVAGRGMSPDDEALVAVIAQSIRDSGHPHGTACDVNTFPADPCTCQWERGSVTMARNVVKAIVGHLAITAPVIGYVYRNPATGVDMTLDPRDVTIVRPGGGAR